MTEDSRSELPQNRLHPSSDFDRLACLLACWPYPEASRTFQDFRSGVEQWQDSPVRSDGESVDGSRGVRVIFALYQRLHSLAV